MVPIEPKRIGGVLLASALASCTVVSVEGGEVRRFAGQLSIVPNEIPGPVTIRKRDYGFVADQGSAVIGYRETYTVVVPPDVECAAVIIVEGEEPQLDFWREQFADNPNICVLGGED